jgi:hypothetical protein
VKNPTKLQEKLVALLRNSKLHIQFPYDRTWNELEMREIACIVQDFVNRNDEVIEGDPFQDWIEEYKFHWADTRTRQFG